MKITRTSNGEKLGVLRELKPNSTWGKSSDSKQLARYLKDAQAKYADVAKWSQELVLYNTTKSAAGVFHKVESGQTLSQIAKIHSTTVAEIAKINNIADVNKIKVGEEFLIKFVPVKPTKGSGEMIKKLNLPLGLEVLGNCYYEV